MENLSPTEENDVASRIARETLVKRGPDYTGEVRRLLDAGRAVMLRCGTGARPRVADIVAEAGLSNDAFYRHFASKDALVAAILDDGTERLVSYLAHQMTKADSAEGRVRRWVEGVLAQASDAQGADTTLAVLWNAGTLGSRSSPTASTAARLATLLPEHLGELGCPEPEVDAVLAAHAVVGTLTDLLWQHRRPTARDVDHLVGFILAACSADGSRPAPRRATSARSDPPSRPRGR